jgi:hypothetical protein
MKFDLSRIEANPSNLYFKELGQNCSDRYNFDGILACHKIVGSAEAIDYSQLFHSGIIECVESYIIGGMDGKPQIPTVGFEGEWLGQIRRLFAVQKELGVEPPLLIMLTLIGVKGYNVIRGTIIFPTREDRSIDRDVLMIPEVLLETFERNLDKSVRPIFDAIWNAAGFARCMNFDEQGNWVGNKNSG